MPVVQSSSTVLPSMDRISTSKRSLGMDDRRYLGAQGSG
jgi:hypothetical protein